MINIEQNREMTNISNENNLRGSTGEEIWSRGSLTDQLEIKSTSPFIVSIYEKLKEKPKLYRYEHGGILVYNSKARIAGDEKNCLNSEKTPRVKKPLSKSESKGMLKQDKQAFLEMQNYSSKPEFLPDFTMEIPKNSLKFNSKFESANLYKAIMISDNLYVLVLEKEPNNACLQWYYFQVTNIKQAVVTFKIINLGKYESLYNEGMKPLIKS